MPVLPRARQKALKHNASALICYHCHPIGTVEPSASDMNLTSWCKDLLDEIDVRLLDHIVVSRVASHCDPGTRQRWHG